MGVDWFVPPSPDASEARATRLFEEHHATAYAIEPSLFSPHVDIRAVTGGWDEFRSLSEQVRSGSGWDWKFGALKKLSSGHSKALGWTLDKETAKSLVFRYGEHAFWASPYPKLDLRGTLAADDAELAGWYVSYAAMDLVECLEWQLAEKSSDLRGNPFVPLLRCYGQGFYPFSLRRDEVVLVSFGGR
jgi:hypothetical protein